MKIYAYESSINGFPAFIEKRRYGWIITDKIGDDMCLTHRNCWARYSDRDYDVAKPPRQLAFPALIFGTPQSANECLKQYERRFPVTQSAVDMLLESTNEGPYGKAEREPLATMLFRHPDLLDFLQRGIRRIQLRWREKIGLSLEWDFEAQRNYIYIKLPETCDEPLVDEWRYGCLVTRVRV